MDIDWKQCVESIRIAPIEKLEDPAWLEYQFLPELGLNDRHMHQYPLYLHPRCGKGLFSWQYPCQFAHYLHYLSTQRISSYVEIGCHKGGTFIITVEYLNRFHPIERALGVDNWKRNRMQEYAAFNPAVNYLPASSLSEEFRKNFHDHQWDLVLVDGDHSYLGAKADYEIVKDNARIVAFHDIVNVFCPGTQQLWHEVKAGNPDGKAMTFIDQYDDVLLRIRGSIMGIGLLHQR